LGNNLGNFQERKYRKKFFFFGGGATFVTHTYRINVALPVSSIGHPEI